MIEFLEGCGADLDQRICEFRRIDARAVADQRLRLTEFARGIHAARANHHVTIEMEYDEAALRHVAANDIALGQRAAGRLQRNVILVRPEPRKLCKVSGAFDDGSTDMFAMGCSVKPVFLPLMFVDAGIVVKRDLAGREH